MPDAADDVVKMPDKDLSDVELTAYQIQTQEEVQITSPYLQDQTGSTGDLDMADAGLAEPAPVAPPFTNADMVSNGQIDSVQNETQTDQTNGLT